MIGFRLQRIAVPSDSSDGNIKDAQPSYRYLIDPNSLTAVALFWGGGGSIVVPFLSGFPVLRGAFFVRRTTSWLAVRFLRYFAVC